MNSMKLSSRLVSQLLRFFTTVVLIAVSFTAGTQSNTDSVLADSPSPSDKQASTALTPSSAWPGPL